MKKALAVLAVLAMAAAAQADLLASWNFTGSTGSDWGAASPIAAHELGANMASASLSVVGAGTGYGTGGNQLRLTNTGWTGTDPSTATSYIDVQLNAAANYTLTVEEIDMRVNGSSTGIKGGNAVWASGTTPISASWATGNNQSYKPELTSNPSGSTVDLRLYASLTGGNWGLTGTTTGTSLAIKGTTTPSVPEPATMSLLGLGALALALRRKLRK